MVAIALTGVLIAGAISSVTFGFRAFSTAKDNQKVTQILKHETERLRLLSWESLSARGPEYAYGVDARFVGEDAGRFTILCLLHERRPHQYEVHLKVVWEDVFGRSRERSASTLVTRNGLNAAYGQF